MIPEEHNEAAGWTRKVFVQTMEQYLNIIKLKGLKGREYGIQQAKGEEVLEIKIGECPILSISPVNTLRWENMKDLYSKE